MSLHQLDAGAVSLARTVAARSSDHEPLSDTARDAQLRILVGVGVDAKPFECVGDPDESAVALARVSDLDEWRDVARLGEIAREAEPRASV